MSKEKHIQMIIECHEREAEDEYHRRVGDDHVYDQITWDNIEPFLPKRGWILDAGGGAGVWSTKIAKQKQCVIVLLDITPKLLETAKRSGALAIESDVLPQAIRTQHLVVSY